MGRKGKGKATVLHHLGGHQQGAQDAGVGSRYKRGGGGSGTGKEKQHTCKEKTRPIPLHNLINAEVESGRFFYSFEYSAARDPDPADLYARVSRMASLKYVTVHVLYTVHTV